MILETIDDFNYMFPDEKACQDWIVKQRWPDGNVKCQYCGHDKCYRIENGNRFKCANNKCYKRFRVTVGTGIQSMNLKLKTWLAFVWVASQEKNASSLGLSRKIGVTQKTSWHMIYPIRNILLNRKDKTNTDIFQEIVSYYLKYNAGSSNGISN